MTRAPIHELPAGYSEIRFVLLTEDRLLLRLNLLAVIPILLTIMLFALWWGIVSPGRVWGAEMPVPWWLALVVAMLIVLPFHELLHGITIMRFGHRVRYGAKLSKGVLYATADRALFRRDEYLAVALAPLVGITLLAMVIQVFAPQWLAYYVAIAAVLNAGGGVGDLWAVGVLLRYPPGVLVRDVADGFRIYAAGSSTQNTEPPSDA